MLVKAEVPMGHTKMSSTSMQPVQDSEDTWAENGYWMIQEHGLYFILFYFAQGEK